MKVVFYASQKPREVLIARALADGVAVHGDHFEMRYTADYGDDRPFEGPTPDTAVAVVFGCKGKSRRILDDHRDLGIATLYIDKGYSRSKGEAGHTEYSRISVNDVHPLAYFQRTPRPSDRWERLGIKLADRRSDTAGGHVLVCTSSEKYHTFHGLVPPRRWAEQLIRSVLGMTARPVVYRPKPSADEVEPISEALYSSGRSSIQQALRGCHVLVTHGATAAMDAVLAGVPAVVTGPAIARPVCETSLTPETVENPRWPDDAARYRWACDMAYTQWTTPEMRSGEAWADLKNTITRRVEPKKARVA